MKENDIFIKKYFETMYAEFFGAFEYAHWKAIIVEVIKESID